MMQNGESSIKQEQEQEQGVKEKDEQNYYVYLLASSKSNMTYVGATTDLDRRLRQHNKELVGGATATGIRVSRGETWRRICHIAGFPTWNAALQFEWRFKQLTRRIPADVARAMGGGSIAKRRHALERLISLDRPTTKAMAYADWPNGVGPIVTWLE
jgi:structure-specific endonuclease subunit SLX1